MDFDAIFNSKKMQVCRFLRDPNSSKRASTIDRNFSVYARANSASLHRNEPRQNSVVLCKRRCKEYNVKHTQVAVLCSQNFFKTFSVSEVNRCILPSIFRRFLTIFGTNFPVHTGLSGRGPCYCESVASPHKSHRNLTHTSVYWAENCLRKA